MIGQTPLSGIDAVFLDHLGVLGHILSSVVSKESLTASMALIQTMVNLRAHVS